MLQKNLVFLFFRKGVTKISHNNEMKNQRQPIIQGVNDLCTYKRRYSIETL